MKQGQISLKRIGIDKTNSRIVGITAIAAFLVMFFLVASYMLFTQLTYQNKVIGVKKKAASQLEANIKAGDSLVASYKSFVGMPQNLLGGNPQGTGPQDGNNAKIVLDALPSRYDFPALTASLEKIALDQHVVIKTITGIDDEVAQAEQGTKGEAKPIPIPFEISVEGDYASTQAFISALGSSIRPFQILTAKVSVDDKGVLTLRLTGQTFYQPEKILNIQKQVVK
jgi:hypothetical protein